MSRSARWLGGACLVVATTAAAHGVDPSIVDVREAPNGRVDVRWTEPTGLIDGPGLQFTPTALRVDFPDHCRMASARTSESVPRGMETRWSLDCGSRGLRDGDIQVPGLLGSAKLVILRFRTARDREPRIAILTGRNDSFRVAAVGNAPSERGAREPARDGWRGAGYLAAVAVLAAIAVLGRRRGWLAWSLMTALLWMAWAFLPFALAVVCSDAGTPPIHWGVAAPGLVVLAASCSRRAPSSVEDERAFDAAARALVLLLPVVVPLAQWSGDGSSSPSSALLLPGAMLAGALAWAATTKLTRLRSALACAIGIFAAIETALAITS